MQKPTFVFVIGGVISGLGKGIFTASLSKIFKLKGYSVLPIKIDPYLNVDAGTMRPTEHGEVWVTYDGGEIDQDLGNYERFLHQKFSKHNNITSGKILWEVINAERNGKFLGKTVQYIPHVTSFIQSKLLKLATKHNSDIVFVEVGGTAGDYEGSLFLHTIARMQHKYNVITIFMGYLLYPPHIRELKTKPFQHALNNLFQFGIRPNILILRSPQQVDQLRINKIADASAINPEYIIPLPDTDNIYEIPITLSKHKAIINLIESSIQNSKQDSTQNSKSSHQEYTKRLSQYKNFVKSIHFINNIKNPITIALVGKYFGTGKFTLTDSYISVIESLKFASWTEKVRLNFKWIDSTNLDSASPHEISQTFQNIHGIIVPGGFGSTGIKGKLKAIQYAREQNIPYLGLCYGLQLAIIEYARNVIKLKDANSTEINAKTKNPVIDILPEQRNILANNQYGASMRLGEYKAYLKKNTIIYQLYKKRNRIYHDQTGPYVIERHRHRYEVNPKYHAVLQDNGIIFSGLSKDKRLVEFIELQTTTHPFFIGTQAHPEFTSYPEDPNPLFWGFIRASKTSSNLHN